jgi:hypothetical protein
VSLNRIQFVNFFPKENLMLRGRLFGVAFAAAVVVGFGMDRLFAADEPANPPARARGQGFAQGGGGLALLKLDVVAKDLALTDEEKESLNKLGDEATAQMKDLRDSLKDASREDRRAKMSDAEKEITKKVDAVLNDKQRARLQEIRLQLRGASALRDKEIGDALKLSEDQTKKLTDLAEARRTAVSDARKDAGGDRAASREKITQITKDSSEKMLDVLTTEQKDQFEKMKGAKLDLGDVRFGSFGGPGRRSADAKPAAQPDSK